MASRAALKWLFLYYVPVLLSCGTSGADKVRDDAKKIATMQCESRELTNQKFLLAGRYSALELQTAEKKLSEAEAEIILVADQVDRPVGGISAEGADVGSCTQGVSMRWWH